MHVWQRGVNRAACFRAPGDRVLYLGLLEEYAALRRVAIHAYVLMDNHIHLLVTPTTDDGCSRLMKDVVQRYSQHRNRAWGRSGPMWEGRFKSCLVDTSDYFVSCMQYIELNPVRARMVADAAHYPWSSHLANAYGEGPSMITPHTAFRKLGRSFDEIRRVYRGLLNEGLSQSRLERIRQALWKELPLGNQDFLDHYERATGLLLPKGWNRPEACTVMVQNRV